METQLQFYIKGGDRMEFLNKGKLVVWDTCSIINIANSVEDFEFDPQRDYIPFVTVEELYGLRKNPNKRKQAIKAIDMLNQDCYFDDTNLKGRTNDDTILKVAQASNAILFTSDCLLIEKCKLHNVEFEFCNVKPKMFKGYLSFDYHTERKQYYDFISVDARLLGDILPPNSYIVLLDGEQLVEGVQYNGKGLRDLYTSKLVRPRNFEQHLVIDLMLDDNIPIKVISGTFGSAKTYISTVLAENMVHEGRYDKLVFTRNADLGIEDSIGYLPGTLEEKTNHLFATNAQYLSQGDFTLEKMKREGSLLLYPTEHLKGLTIDNAIVLFDEAEDSVPLTIREVGSRIGKDSSIVFTGDWKQAHGIYSENNGLKYLLENTIENSLVGSLILKINTRSKASRVFSSL